MQDSQGSLLSNNTISEQQSLPYLLLKKKFLSIQKFFYYIRQSFLLSSLGRTFFTEFVIFYHQFLKAEIFAQLNRENAGTKYGKFCNKMLLMRTINDYDPLERHVYRQLVSKRLRNSDILKLVSCKAQNMYLSNALKNIYFKIVYLFSKYSMIVKENVIYYR